MSWSWEPDPTGSPPPSPCAEAGRSVLVLEAADTIGGGARTAELTLPGLPARRVLGHPPAGGGVAVLRGGRPRAPRPRARPPRGGARPPARRRARRGAPPIARRHRRPASGRDGAAWDRTRRLGGAPLAVAGAGGARPARCGCPGTRSRMAGFGLRALPPATWLGAVVPHRRGARAVRRRAPPTRSSRCRARRPRRWG